MNTQPNSRTGRKPVSDWQHRARCRNCGVKAAGNRKVTICGLCGCRVMAL